ncbi:hypothetical protein NEMBOFW57_005656 [Staphylotrichum longicolle]|uniref:Dienelactone hydrolase domain-containing protein n=1 Tax=Staphylotrichum longicolle TaxID=669026 RepID=A0AAD4I0H5_9PEZI|nr:hypothetical protein NEMBOFW57_005656 [Staphylotrichum longicolle]
MSTPACCLRATLWSGTPTGSESAFPSLPCNPFYLAAAPPPNFPTPHARPPRPVAILVVHDMFGWTLPNARLLADAYAREARADVYLPDFFGGEVVSFEALSAGRWDEIDLEGWRARNARAVREPEIVAFARVLKESGRYERVGAIGFCWGGWTVLRLGAREFGGGLVDCVSMGHPSWVTEEDVEGVDVSVQVVAPEVDHVFTEEMKLFTFKTLMRKGVAFEYLHLPGVEHGCLSRGDADKKGEREAMVRGKNAAVAWFRQWLHDDE